MNYLGNKNSSEVILNVSMVPTNVLKAAAYVFISGNLCAYIAFWGPNCRRHIEAYPTPAL